MTKELSEKDKRMKEMMEKTMANPDITWLGRGRHFFNLLPSDPRCAACMAPFEGAGGVLVRALLDKRRSQMNPLYCNQCEESAKRLRAGTELDMSMLFADIRGSTPLAESMNPNEFKQLIDRFYTATTHVLFRSLAMIDKLAGDEVSGFYFPGYLGRDYAAKSVEAAREILEVTGHSDPGGPWVPVGVGINTGRAYFGVVGTGDELVEMTALGDEVNVAARLASQAAAGEIILSESTVRQASLDTGDLEQRTLALKGKSQPLDVWVIKVQPGGN